MMQMISLVLLLLVFVSGKNVCDVCHCNQMIIYCSEENIISDFSDFQPANYKSVTDISISNQPRLTKLDYTCLRLYTNLKTLSITKSGLINISLNAFESNRLLETVDFENNRIAVLSWKIFDGLANVKLFIEGNPLRCTCANKWIQLSKINYSIMNLPQWPLIKSPAASLLCQDEFGQNNWLVHYNFNKESFIIELPIMRLNPEQVELHEGDPFTAQCISEETTDLVKWDTDPLYSSIKTFDAKYGQILQVSRVHHQDMGDIICIAENQVGRTSKALRLKVHEIISFTPPNSSVGVNNVAVMIGNPNNHDIGKQNENADFKMKMVALIIALVTTCIIAFTFCVLYLYKRNTSDRVLTTPIESQLYPLRADRSNSGSIPSTPWTITREILAMTDNILYEETSGQQHYESISMQAASVIIPVGYKTISSTLLRPMQHLGQGDFGQVYLASLFLCDSKDQVLVVVNVFKNSSNALRREFDREANLLTSLTHDNIIRFYGACVDNEPFQMAFEYMIKGDLNQFLRKKGPGASMLRARQKVNYVSAESLAVCKYDYFETLSVSQLLKIAKDISAGVAYLHMENCVHRDLATRNCLVGEELVVKLGDYGMSRHIYNADYCCIDASQVLLPVRWMSPESITYRTFSQESDVWSFGIVLWEIMSFGKRPWYGYSNAQAIKNITGGYVLGQPPDCSPYLYELMLSCWTDEPQRRMNMEDIDQRLHELLTGQPPPLIFITPATPE